MHPAAMLIENLKNEEYMKIIGCGDIHDLGAVFALYDKEAQTEYAERIAANKKAAFVPRKILRHEKFIFNFKETLTEAFNFLFKAS